MYIFIINQKAGGGRAAQIFKRIKKHPLYHGVSCKSYVTEYTGHAEKLAQQMATTYLSEIQCLIVIGGDGTVHECVNGLKDFPDIPVACIPAGSGNDFVRGYGISGDPIKLFERIVKGENIEYWSGNFWTNSKVEDHKKLFVNTISFGFDAEITKTANRATYKRWLNKWKLGSISYVIALFQVLKKFRTLSLEIEVDGKKQTFNNVLMVTISNLPYYGGGMKINPSASIGPSVMPLLIIQDLSPWKIPLFFVSVFFGWHIYLKEVTVIQGKHFSVNAKTLMTFQVDGQTGECEFCNISKEEESRRITGVRF